MVKRALLFLLLLISIFVVWQYVLDVKYKFPETKPFSGKYFYNPYQNIDTSRWQVANFHAHTRVWNGFTNGRNNASEAVDSLYHFLGYNIYNISDYQQINSFEKNNPWYIPTYEHGYLPSKNHQLVLNAKEVRWIDYLFPQTLHNMQHIINRIKEDTSCTLAIAHPNMQERYDPDDFKSLCNYDLIEALNSQRFSIEHWDAALSSGHASFIIADDDIHDLTKANEAGNCCTVINTPLQKDSILNALKAGCAYGVDVQTGYDKAYPRKKFVIETLPRLEKVFLSGDTLWIRINQEAHQFRFIGQQGVVKKRVYHVKEAFYILSPEDTYIRTEIGMDSRTILYLNPIFRYDGSNIPKYFATVDSLKTWSWRIGFLIFVTVIFFFRKKKHS